MASDWSVKVGLGLGVGYLSMDGTIMVNTPPGPRVEQFDGSDLSYSTGIIIRYEYKNMIIQAKEYTPFATIDGLEMELQLPIFTVGYKYSFWNIEKVGTREQLFLTESMGSDLIDSRNNRGQATIKIKGDVGII